MFALDTQVRMYKLPRDSSFKKKKKNFKPKQMKVSKFALQQVLRNADFKLHFELKFLLVLKLMCTLLLISKTFC